MHRRAKRIDVRLGGLYNWLNFILYHIYTSKPNPVNRWKPVLSC